MVEWWWDVWQHEWMGRVALEVPREQQRWRQIRTLSLVMRGRGFGCNIRLATMNAGHPTMIVMLGEVGCCVGREGIVVLPSLWTWRPSSMQQSNKIEASRLGCSIATRLFSIAKCQALAIFIARILKIALLGEVCENKNSSWEGRGGQGTIFLVQLFAVIVDVGQRPICVFWLKKTVVFVFWGGGGDKGLFLVGGKGYPPQNF